MIQRRPLLCSYNPFLATCGRALLLLPFLLFALSPVSGQEHADYFAHHNFTQADTLRGALRPERTSFDVTYYELHLEVNTNERSIEGRVEMDYKVVQVTNRLQLDLFQNLTIDSIKQDGRHLPFERQANAVFITLPRLISPDNAVRRMSVWYGGKPIAAKNAPWDGGFVWSLDHKDRTWVGIACEGTGASLWWPNKDHLSDEPDSMLVSVTVPKRLFVASNGNLREEVELENRYQKRYDWFVSYPINNYNISLGIGSYVHFDSTYVAFDGEVLDLDYYVLDYNEDRARKHFQQVGPMLAAYEHYFGKYPFWDDGYALIETPYLGMEHQSGIAYGNRYMRGYLGGMLPDDMDWDFIIIHETGHEYFGNSISVADHGEMWIHESFTTYMEALYVEYLYGKKDAVRYLNTQLKYIKNESPILGPQGVNFDDFGSSDHYYKGSWVLHTLRHVLNDDGLFFGMLRSFYQDHQRSIVNTQQVIDYFSRYAKKDLSPFFAQYLEHPDLPVLELRQTGQQVEYRWRTNVAAFNYPVDVLIGSETVRLDATQQWQVMGKGFSPRDVSVESDKYLVEIGWVRQP
jgi:aminopeptidase N